MGRATLSSKKSSRPFDSTVKKKGSLRTPHKRVAAAVSCVLLGVAFVLVGLFGGTASAGTKGGGGHSGYACSPIFADGVRVSAADNTAYESGNVTYFASGGYVDLRPGDYVIKDTDGNVVGSISISPSDVKNCGSDTSPPTTSEESTPPSTSEESTPPDTSEESTPPDTSEESTPPSTSEESTPPDTSEESTPPSSSEESTPPSTSEESTPPSTSEESTPPPTDVCPNLRGDQAEIPPGYHVLESGPYKGWCVENEPPSSSEESTPPSSSEVPPSTVTSTVTPPPATTTVAQPPVTVTESGAPGPQGPQGPQGPAGPQGDSGAVVVVQGDTHPHGNAWQLQGDVQTYGAGSGATGDALPVTGFGLAKLTLWVGVALIVLGAVLGGSGLLGRRRQASGHAA